MKKSLLIAFALIFSVSLFANDFVSLFLDRYAEDKRPVSNVNIGKTMLNKMSENTDDEDLKNTFKELNSIRIVTTENKKDSKYYFKKANELVKESFSDYEEVVSVNERKSKIHILMKKLNDVTQELILIALDEDSKLTIITVSGKINFDSISKLSDILKKEAIPSSEEQLQKSTQ